MHSINVNILILISKVTIIATKRVDTSKHQGELLTVLYMNSSLMSFSAIIAEEKPSTMT